MPVGTSRLGRALLNTALVLATLAVLLGIGECGLRLAALRDEPLERRPPLDEWKGLPEIVSMQDLMGRNVRGIRNGITTTRGSSAASLPAASCSRTACTRVTPGSS